VARLIACKDASLFEAFSCPWTPPATFYKLLEIERATFAHDGTERRIVRPQDAAEQKECYSGKKKDHTVKNTMIRPKARIDFPLRGYPETRLGKKVALLDS